MTPAVFPSGAPVGCGCPECLGRWRSAWSMHVLKQSFPRAEYDWPSLEAADRASRRR